MADLDPAAADEGQMLRPEPRPDLVAEPGHSLHALRLHRRGRGHAQRDAVQRDIRLRGQRAQRAPFRSRRLEEIVRDHFHQIDPVEMSQNAHGQLPPPAEAESIAGRFFRLLDHDDPQPPHPPPPQPLPPPSLPLLLHEEEEPQEEPHPELEACGKSVLA